VFQSLGKSLAIFSGALGMRKMDVLLFGNQDGKANVPPSPPLLFPLICTECIFIFFFLLKCRLRLLEEDSIEFSEFNLWNNVAQILVFEVPGFTSKNHLVQSIN
jgi:hypothetical protein